MGKIPAHIFWPGLVVAILVFAVASQMALLAASRWDGGPQIEEDYYARSLEWEETQALKARSDALGWRADVALTREVGAKGQIVELTILDAQGSPVEGLEGSLTLRHPSLSKPIGTSPLSAARPGVYRAEAAVSRSGLWDFEVNAVRGETPYVTRLRREFGAL